MSNPIKTVVAESFSNHKFRKKADTWYYDCPETLLVANLQKSQYGDSYFINLGVWLKSLGESSAPKENHCHIRIRLESIMGKSIEQALNMEYVGLDEVERNQIIEAAIESAAIPFLMSCNTIDKIKCQLDNGHLSKAMVNKRIREIVSSK